MLFRWPDRREVLKAGEVGTIRPCPVLHDRTWKLVWMNLDMAGIKYARTEPINCRGIDYR
jgi:hypothetical protein